MKSRVTVAIFTVVVLFFALNSTAQAGQQSLYADVMDFTPDIHLFEGESFSHTFDLDKDMLTFYLYPEDPAWTTPIGTGSMRPYDLVISAWCNVFFTGNPEAPDNNGRVYMNNELRFDDQVYINGWISVANDNKLIAQIRNSHKLDLLVECTKGDFYLTQATLPGLYQPVPEPTTLSLLGLGLLGVVFRRKKTC